jgi:hypothetical protein
MAKHPEVQEGFNGGQVDLGVLEEQIRTVPERPSALRPASMQTDADLAEGFKRRLLLALAEHAAILDEMKTAGPFACNFQWGVDASGRHFVSMIQISRIYT